MDGGTEGDRCCTNQFRLRFDAAVYGSEGRLGTLRRVILDPCDHRVLSLVVGSGGPFPRELTVPLERVVTATEDTVHVAPSTGEERQSEVESEGAPVLSDGSRIRALDGATAWRASQLLVSATSGRMLELVIAAGPLTSGKRRLPAGWVREIHTVVEVQATRAALAALPHYRGDRELRADILDAWFYDDWLRPTLLRTPLDVKLCEGRATLEGHVPTRRISLRLEETARSIPGVVEVRNRLVVDDDLTHQVMNALLEDPRTSLLRPRVWSHLGVIYLEGEVPHGAAHQAASEVAAAVPGARGVLNRLREGGATLTRSVTRLLRDFVKTNA